MAAKVSRGGSPSVEESVKISVLVLYDQLHAYSDGL